MGRARLLPLVLLAAATSTGVAVGTEPATQQPVRAEAGVQPFVTLRLDVTAVGVDGARVTVRGAFRGRAVAGRAVYRLAPIGAARTTRIHAPGTTQRARITAAFLDRTSDATHVRVVVAAIAPEGAAADCRQVAVRFTARPPAGSATVRWACRPDGAGNTPPTHLDVLRQPPDAITSTYTITRRPCSRAAPLRAASTSCRGLI